MTFAPADLLVVDDDVAIRASICRIVTSAGHGCVAAASVEEAREHLANGSFELVVTDMTMPGRSGLELLSQVRELNPDTAVIVVTGRDDQELAEVTLRSGAYGYLIKPFRPSELLINVSNALRRRDLEREARLGRQRLETMVRERSNELWNALQAVLRREQDLRRSRQDTIERLSIAAEFRDEDTAAHVRRMSRYSGMLAGWAGVARERAEMIRVASVMHDVGKIGIPDAILLKPGKLTRHEFEIMKSHTAYGFRILTGADSGLLDLAASIALTHHERVDGSGYPRGLSGDAIPLEGRIAAIADVFDAVTTRRVYSPAVSIPRALTIMLEARGTHLDGELTNLFIAHLDEVLRVKEAEDEEVSPSV